MEEEKSQILLLSGRTPILRRLRLLLSGRPPLLLLHLHLRPHPPLRQRRPRCRLLLQQKHKLLREHRPVLPAEALCLLRLSRAAIMGTRGTCHCRLLHTTRRSSRTMG